MDSKVIKAKDVKKGMYFLGRVTNSENCGYDGVEVNDDDGVVENVVRGGTKKDSITLMIDTGIEVELSQDEKVAVQVKTTF